MSPRVIYYLALTFFCLLYIYVSPTTPFTGSFVLKALPIWMLAAHVFMTLKDRKGRLLLVGVLFGSAGDVALTTEFEHSLLLGLGLFLIGHVFYIASFAHQWQFKTWKIIPSGLVLLLSVGLSIVLTPHLNGLTIPVYAYIFVITLMAVLAIFRRPPSPAVWIGAVLFILSDALIALREFAEMDIPHPSVLIMSTYYLAQVLIAEGSIEDERNAKARK